jgi:hypothetical protein
MPVPTLYTEQFWIYWAALFSFGCGILAGGILVDLVFNMYYKVDETQSDEYFENKYRTDCRNKFLLVLLVVGIVIVLLVLEMVVNTGKTV